MKGSAVTVSVHIDAKLFRDFALFDTLRIKGRWKSPALFALIMVGFSILCFSLQGRANQAILMGTVLLTVGMGLPVVYFGNFLGSIGKQITKQKLEKPQQVYIVTLTDEPDGIQVVTKNGERGRYRWDGVTGVYRRRDCTYLYVQGGRAFLLPHRDVAEKSQALQGLLDRQVGERLRYSDQT